MVAVDNRSTALTERNPPVDGVGAASTMSGSRGGNADGWKKAEMAGRMVRAYSPYEFLLAFFLGLPP